MKYLKLYEEIDRFKEFIIVKSKLNDGVDYFLLHIISFENYQIEYDSYVPINVTGVKGRKTSYWEKFLDTTYDSFDFSYKFIKNKTSIDNLIIFFQSYSEEECYYKLKELVEILVSANKYNLLWNI